MSDLRDAHDREVGRIQNQVRNFYKTKQKAKMYHGASNSTRPFSANGLQYIDVSKLTRIIKIDQRQHYVLVEPNVPLDRLVEATRQYGLVPPMVAEFPGITVGGAVQGGSGESSSFKSGLFDETCLEYEIVLGDGSKLTASTTQNADLYAGMSCAFGSLGVLTLLKIKLVPATSYVKLAYYKVDSFAAAVANIQDHVQTEVDFVDGILFSKDSGVIMVGTYTDEAVLPLARFGRVIDDWFYIHAQNISKQHDFHEEIIPLQEYLFRYDRGAFWTAKYGFHHVPFNRFTRTLFAGFFRTRTLFKLLHGSHYGYVYLAQDICLPQRNVTKFLRFADRDFAIYPLWLCPLKPTAAHKLSPTAISTDLVINVGIWGELQPSELDFKARNRQLEAKVRRLSGRKVLYAHAYYAQTEFWQIYDHAGYQKLRSKYNAETVLPDVYQKTKTVVAPPAPPSKRKGLLALLSSPYKPK